MSVFNRLFALVFAFALLLAPFALAPAQARAQERPATILVLDASGSMWGQIDGVNKIVIAREVVAAILADFPADQDLGLVAYGHNRRGDCTDIETLVAPAPGTAAQIAGIVNGLNPRGMTPMTDAVIAAAESLRYTENAATVILVSDGIETCNPDPCAAARVLEETGVDFTAHVVGFDVSGEEEALAQMRCIADETGGRFLTADDAGELRAAMEEVVEEVTTRPAPPQAEPPHTGQVRITALLGSAGGEPVPAPVLWTLEDAFGTLVADGPDDNPLLRDLAPGTYTVHAVNTADDATGSAIFTVTPGAQAITVILPAATPTATLDAPATAPAGSSVTIGWTGPDAQFDNIQIGLPDGPALQYTYVETGNPLTLIMPGEPGVYELRYQWQDLHPIARQPITVTEATLALVAPDSVPGGATIAVDWRGPDQQYDNIQVGLPGQGASDYRYTSEGSPVRLIMPWAPGTYELRYQFQDREAILTRPITVTPGEVSITAPASAAAGTRIEVHWTGPDAQYDNIQIGPAGSDSYGDYAYTSDGTPLTLILPGEPGDYELRYRFRDRETILLQPLTVLAQDAALSVPKGLTMGASVLIGWTGPGLEGDFIAIGRPGEGYVTWAMTADGNPVAITLPPEPGTWEVRYVLGAGEEVLARQTVTLDAVTATLSAPATARPGADLAVSWTGPGHEGDFIGLGRPGEGYVTWAMTADGNPVTLSLPEEGGAWELRYYMAEGETVLATQPLLLSTKP
ncbi:MAG: VWA domain-containing protein [Rubellimicrobium sp.]|nr:VWA domain-containing protein [Rubellimicrobium sp.]